MNGPASSCFKTQKNSDDPHIPFTLEMDERFMRFAIRLGRRGLGRTAPNPCVGAVLVSPQGHILSYARTANAGRPHAERQALDAAGAAARNACCYVTLEPCSHHGKTAPCADALIASGVSRVVVALKDPDPRVSGRGLDRLRQAGIQVVTDVLSEEARRLHDGHVSRVTRNRPHIQLKLATSPDGFIGLRGAGQVSITGPDARQAVHLMRAEADAILVGIETVLADDPDLRCRLPGLEASSPIRVVLDRRGRMPLDSRLLETARQTPLWLVVGPDASDDYLASCEVLGARIIRSPVSSRGVDLAPLVAFLADEGITTLFVEGGARIARSFLEAGYVDEFLHFIGGNRLGAGGIPALAGLNIADVLRDNRVKRDRDFVLTEDRLFGADRFRRYRKGDKSMFTGIVTDKGGIHAIDPRPSGARITIVSAYDAASVDLGASIACAGICLTVVDSEQQDDGTSLFRFDVSRETLDRTNLGQWQVGDAVNLERPLTLGTELGGHVVTGHVDGLAEIVERTDHDDTSFFRLRAPHELAKFIAEKGSVTLDGTSLTVNAVDGDTFTIMLIPHTLTVTSWGMRQPGDRVNLEVDLMARYAARLAEYNT